jgi:hypothetical protein
LRCLLLRLLWQAPLLPLLLLITFTSPCPGLNKHFLSNVAAAASSRFESNCLLDLSLLTTTAIATIIISSSSSPPVT